MVRIILLHSGILLYPQTRDNEAGKQRVKKERKKEKKTCYVMYDVFFMFLKFTAQRNDFRKFKYLEIDK